jgi:excisionase family DNA binding protein
MHEDEFKEFLKASFFECFKEKKFNENAQANNLLSLNEAVSFLNLAKPTIYGLTSKRLIPFIKKGKKLYFSQADLKKWLLEGKQPTRQEIENNGIPSLKNKGGK